MNSLKNSVSARGILWCLGVIIFSNGGLARAQDPAGFSQYVDASGNISLPPDFETKFMHLGTIAVAPKSDAPVNELHSTFAAAKDVEAFQKDGKFPDGAVLVKAVRGVSHDQMTTGETSFGADVKVWFVMVKDDKQRFKDHPLWGKGWGWALFNGDDRKTQIATDYQTDCLSCHIPAKQTDWIYTKCYPILKHSPAAK